MAISTKITAIALGAVILTGCATMKHGTDQTVAVSTGDVKGAHCKMKNSKGQWTVRNTPGRAKVKRGSDKLHVVCTKPGLSPASLAVKSKVDPILLGNVAMPGGSAGAVIDFANGAAYQYPEKIVVPFKR